MKITISNIAWQMEEEKAIADVMQEMEIKGVEIAPTKVWSSPFSATDSDIKKYKQFWESKNIQIVAMQSLLFGRPDLTIFDSPAKRKETFDCLVGMIHLGGRLGAKVLVFGSPKNRNVRDLPEAEINGIAVPFFHELGQVALEHDLTFCIEPNPAAYGCDFITTSRQGLDLVHKVNSKGFGLHLDAAGMTLSQETIESSIKNAIPEIRHFHVNEVNLARLGAGTVNHNKFASILKEVNYENWISIEMRASVEGKNIDQARTSLSHIISIYG
jgi:D-psicose/D-tagatose/L-ribulose 3-epimerase